MASLRSHYAKYVPCFSGLIVALTALCAFSGTARAQGRRTFRSARLTYVQGTVNVERANSTMETAAVVNMPLVEGTVISSGEDGQAEIEFEDGSLARLTPNSGLSLLNLAVDASGNFQTRIALLGGLAYFELRAGTKFQYSVDAGGDVISPVENATIRVNLDEPPAVIAVLDGTARLVSVNGSASGASVATSGAGDVSTVGSTGGPTIDADAGQTVRADAASEGGLYMVKQAIAPESWDRWNEDRDQAAADEAGTQTDARTKYAGDQGYGWSDLDANGSWYNVPGQGEVWQPNDAALGDPGDSGQADAGQQAPDQSGFDPYSYGSWSYTPAGYLWASGYGWGWLPYRCGSWSYFDGFGWGWSPGVACGLYGFGGYGGFLYGVNIGNAPGWYRRPHRPIPGPGPVHPILRGRGGPMPILTSAMRTGGGYNVSGPKTIAGKTVERLEPVGGGYTPRGGSAIGSGLQRDYPIDRATHSPVTGLLATHFAPATATSVRAPWQPVNHGERAAYPGYPGYAAGGPQGYAPRAYNPQTGQGSGRPAPVTRQAPARQAAPAPRSAPAPVAHASSPSPHGK